MSNYFSETYAGLMHRTFRTMSENPELYLIECMLEELDDATFRRFVGYFIAYYLHDRQPKLEYGDTYRWEAQYKPLIDRLK